MKIIAVCASFLKYPFLGGIEEKNTEKIDDLLQNTDADNQRVISRAET